MAAPIAAPLRGTTTTTTTNITITRVLRLDRV